MVGQSITTVRKYKIRIENCKHLSDLSKWCEVSKDEIINMLIEQAYINASQTLKHDKEQGNKS